eukprot:scaffold4600_cov74-Phaeocystis_antarctica.AAC.10
MPDVKSRARHEDRSCSEMESPIDRTWAPSGKSWHSSLPVSAGCAVSPFSRHVYRHDVSAAQVPPRAPPTLSTLPDFSSRHTTAWLRKTLWL